MPSVKVSITGASVMSYWLEIFNQNGHLFVGETNEDFDGNLPSGPYTLLYRVIGTSRSEYSINFEGVTRPQSPYTKKIPNKGYTAATITMRE